MQNYQNKKQIALNVLEQTAKVAESRGSKDAAEELRKEGDHLRSGELNVVVCGECKRGKSSLISAFLEEPELCPSDAPITTNVITVIRYAEKEKFFVHLLDEKAVVTKREITRGQIKEYATEQGNARNQRRVQLIEIWLNNAKLKDGLVLMDTPGIGSLSAEHTAATYSIIPYADAVIFVGEAAEPLTTPELDFCERIVKHTSHVLHVVTKRDSVSNAEDILGSNVSKLFSRLGSKVKGVAVSSTLKMEYFKDHDEETLALSGFSTLEKLVWEMLADRGDILLNRALGKLLPTLAQLLLPLQTEQVGLSSSSAEELKEIDDELQAMIKRADELSLESSFWMNELNRQMTILQSDCNSWLGNEFTEVNRKLGNYLNVDDYLNDSKKLSDMLVVDCNNGFASVISQVEGELNKITNDLRKLTSLANIKGGHATARGTVGIDLSGASGRRRDSFLYKASTVGRSFSIHSMGLAVVGGIAAAIIGGILGTFAAPGAGTIAGAQLLWPAGASVGGALGALFGLKRGIQDLSERDLAALRQNLGAICREQLATAQRTITHELNVLLTNAKSEIHQSLVREIQSEQRACKDAAGSLAKARQEKHSDVSGRLRELNNSIKFLNNLIETASKLMGDDVTPAQAKATA
jgi:Mg2+ and Co2+ transporter CorA/GTPase SAR1 family protein